MPRQETQREDEEKEASNTKSQKLIFAPGSQNQQQQADQFLSATLHRSHLDPDPFTQFHNWFSHPTLQGLVPETCTLSTAELPSGRVSSRMVYLKELDAGGGFVIYSNWGTSRKAHDLETNKHVALCFWWKALERQVRVEGRGQRLTRNESQVYFETRATESKVGAHASRQSEVLRPLRERRLDGGATSEDVESTKREVREGGEEEGPGIRSEEEDDGRAQLDERVDLVVLQTQGSDDIRVPEFWGGLRIIPDMLEFWQGRESRLHDRFRYLKVEPGQGDQGSRWKIDRLSP